MAQTTFDKRRFDTDNLLGKLGEQTFKEHREKRMNTFVYSTDKNAAQPDFDVIEYNTRTQELAKHEIKTDRYNSPNVAVQIWNSSKAETSLGLQNWKHSCNSGIYATKADYFTVYNVHDHTFYIAEPAKLREYIEKNPQLRKTIANLKKTEQTGIVLIPKTEWINFGWVEQCD